jgi:hypothetical protein
VLEGLFCVNNWTGRGGGIDGGGDVKDAERQQHSDKTARQKNWIR